MNLVTETPYDPAQLGVRGGCHFGPKLFCVYNISINNYEYMEQIAKQQLKCPLCGETKFKDEKGKLESEWGMTKYIYG